MAAVDLPYLWLPVIKRKRYAYYRRGGLRTRLPTLDTPGFLAAYEAAHAAGELRATATPAERDGPAPGSLAALVAAYKASPEWAAHAPATRVDYLKALDPLADRYGRPQVKQMTRAFVFRLRDEYATKPQVDGRGRAVLGPDGVQLIQDTPRRANRVVNVLRLLLAWGVNRGWRDDNPAAKPGRLKTGDGYVAWTLDEVQAFMDCPRIGEPLLRAAVLGLCSGQRKQDCLVMGHADRADGGIHVVQIKTKAKVWIPEHPDLTRVLAAAPNTGAATLLTRPDGQPWAEDHFNHAFADAAASANLRGLTFHGLRKASAGWMAEAGCSASEIMAITGHRTMGEVTRYTAGADQKRRAIAAMGRVSGTRIGAGSDKPREAEVINTPTPVLEPTISH